MNNSPWSAYGRNQDNGGTPSPGKPDPTLGAAREAMLTHEQLRSYLAHTLHEFNEIRAGRTGYASIVAAALTPPTRPETIEETLRRLSGALTKSRKHPGDSSSTL
jgi:hypothetical protein